MNYPELSWKKEALFSRRIAQFARNNSARRLRNLMNKLSLLYLAAIHSTRVAYCLGSKVVERVLYADMH